MSKDINPNRVTVGPGPYFVTGIRPDTHGTASCLVMTRDTIRMEIEDLERQNAENVMAISRKVAEISEIHKELARLTR